MIQARKYVLQAARTLSGCSSGHYAAALADARAPRTCVYVADGSSLLTRGRSVSGQAQPITFNLAQPGEGIHECEILQWHVEQPEECTAYQWHARALLSSSWETMDCCRCHELLSPPAETRHSQQQTATSSNLPRSFQVGRAIQAFDPLLEVQSDKANVEITSPYSGVIQAMHGSVGDMIKVGSPLVDIQVNDAEGVTKQAHAAVHNTQSTWAVDILSGSPLAANAVKDSLELPQNVHHEGTSSCAQGQRPILASPAVRALAREHGVALKAIAGSGPDGRVLKGDVLEFLNPGSSEPTTSSILDATLQPSICTSRSPENIIQLRGYRRSMVNVMAAATAIPHFHLCDDVQLDALIATRDTLRSSMHDVRLSVLPLLIKALSLALVRHPEVNARLGKDLDCLHLIRDHNVGIAIATEKGLVVPCIRAVQDLSVYDIATCLHELKQKAHHSHLQPEDLADTSITLSNIGVIGGQYATPIVNAPQLAICALGRLRKGFVFSSDDQPEVANIMSVSWGADHRALDGATLARFNNTWKRLIQDPVSMLLHTK